MYDVNYDGDFLKSNEYICYLQVNQSRNIRTTKELFLIYQMSNLMSIFATFRHIFKTMDFIFVNVLSFYTQLDIHILHPIRYSHLTSNFILIRYSDLTSN